jgi:thioredoxin-like negative regulator of GroEL
MPVVIKFHTLWDASCRSFSAIFEELSKEYAGSIKFCESNIDGNSDIAEQLSIAKVPSIVIFCWGKEIKRMVYPSRMAFKAELDSALKKAKRF